MLKTHASFTKYGIQVLLIIMIPIIIKPSHQRRKTFDAPICLYENFGTQGGREFFRNASPTPWHFLAVAGIDERLDERRGVAPASICHYGRFVLVRTEARPSGSRYGYGVLFLSLSLTYSLTLSVFFHSRTALHYRCRSLVRVRAAEGGVIVGERI